MYGCIGSAAIPRRRMISFACKQIDFKDLLVCSFSLNKTEYRLLIYLLEQDETLGVATIANHIKKDRTTVQKAMKSLAEKELVTKHQINLERGGYSFQYKAITKDAIKSRMLATVDQWHANVMTTVKKW